MRIYTKKKVFNTKKRLFLRLYLTSTTECVHTHYIIDYMNIMKQINAKCKQSLSQKQKKVNNSLKNEPISSGLNNVEVPRQPFFQEFGNGVLSPWKSRNEQLLISFYQKNEKNNLYIKKKA